MGKDLRDKLRVGMAYDELVQLLGEPSAVDEGSRLLSGRGTFIGSERTKAYLMRTRYCCWRRTEAEYYLTVTDGKLASIHSIVPSNPRVAPDKGSETE